MSVLLYPNFGAEEGERTSIPSTQRRGRGVLALLWALLFDDAVQIDDDDRPRARPSWFPSNGSAFEWLDDLRGLVPWLSTDDAERHATKQRLAWGAPSPHIVTALSDKAWAFEVARRAGLHPPPVVESVLPIDATLFADPTSAAAELEAWMGRWPSWVEEYTLKPRLGSSGRGRVAGRVPTLPPQAVASFARFAAHRGVMLEPWFARIQDLSVQLLVESDRVTILATTQQLLRPAGLYEGNCGVLTPTGIRSGTPFDEALIHAGQVIGEAARAAGYRGPCGIDAFAFAHQDQVYLRSVVELNARFTTGTIAIGMVERARAAGFLRVGQPWLFHLGVRALDRAVLEQASHVLPLGETPSSLCCGGAGCDISSWGRAISGQ